MSSGMFRCKITVLQRNINRDLIEAYLDETARGMQPCECFEEGQEFIIQREEDFASVPQGFCAWAWADIRREIIHIATGGHSPGYTNTGMSIAGCTDWFRPVLFKIERMETD